MSRSSSFRPVLSALALVSFLTATASAFCGLQSCPRPAGHGETPTVEAALRNRFVSYDIGADEGHYLVTAPRVFFNYNGFAVGAEVPFTRLDNGGSISTGFSNPVVMGRYARRLSYAWSGEVGVQWELPLGNQADGLAGDHHMLLPWFGLRRDFSAASGTMWYATGMFGVSTAVEFGHHDADTMSSSAHTASTGFAKLAHGGEDHGSTGEAAVLVNPHADREVQARLGVGWMHGRGTLEGFTLAQTDLTAAHTGTYARVGSSYEWKLGRFTALQVIGDLPVTSTRRNSGELGLTVKTGI
jgi:hypothetical protein